MRYLNLLPIALLAATVIIASPLEAQDCLSYFDIEEGSLYTYTVSDNRDVVTGSVELLLREKSSTPDSMTAEFDATFLDTRGNSWYESPYIVKCSDGVLYIDYHLLLDPSTMSGYKGMDVKATGDFLELPLNAAYGTKLVGGKAGAVVSSNGVEIMEMKVEVSNRILKSHESLTTPAGSFDCARISYDILSWIGGVKVEHSYIEWYNVAHGLIKRETYDKKEKLISRMYLLSFSE